MSDKNVPEFRSGLRRLLYPAVHRSVPTDEAGSERLTELMHRLELRPDDCRVLPAAQRTFDGRLVDVASGEVMIEQVDVDIPGPVPFRWRRFWRSDQLAAGPLGFGWRHSYDFALLEDRPGHRVVMRLPDNRGVLFPLLAEGEQYLHRAEQLRLSRDVNGYRLQGVDGLGYRFALNPGGSICRLVAVDRIGTPYRIRLMYAGSGQLRRICDDFQRVIDIVTDTQGRISQLAITAPDQPKSLTLVAYAYDETQNLKDVVAQGQRLAQYIYRHNRLIRLTDASRQSVYLAYEKTGHQYRCSEVNGEADSVRLRFRYLSAEGRTQVTDLAGGVRQYIHEEGRVQRFISAGGHQRVWFFSAYGELLSEQDALGNTAFFTYDAQGNLTQAAWPDGGNMQMHYNEAGQLTALTDRAGGSWLWTHDEAERLLSCTDPTGAETWFIYTEDGLLNQKKRTGGDWVRWEYDQYANRKAQLTATNTRIDWEYDFLGRLKTPGQPGESRPEPLPETRQSMDQFQPTYDADGQLIRLRRTDQLNWQFMRDAAGRVREYIRSDGSSTRFHHDAAGRLTEVLFNDGTWHQYTYRPDGWLIQAATPTMLVQFERDPLGRILAETGGQTGVQTDYDRAGHRVRLRSSAGAAVAYAYDELGRLNKQQHAQAKIQFTYDRLGRPAERQMPGGLRSRWQYESGPLPTSHQLFWGSSLQAARWQTYNWDAQRLMQLQDGRFGTVQLRYDSGDQPIEAICSTGWTDRWVAHRSRYQQLLKPAPDIPGRGWRMIAVGGLRFYYDADGYLREKRAAGQVWLFHWHESGVLQNVIRPDNRSVSFGYDALGRRIEKTFDSHRVRWAWAANRLLHEWQHPAGKDPLQLTWYPAGGAEPTLLQVGEKIYTLVCNYLGHPLSVHDELGAPVWTWQWCLFGRKRTLTGPPYAPAFLGPGQFEDPEAGLMYANFRYYDTDTGLPISPEYSSPAGWARSGWEPPHAPESYLSAARCIRAY